LKPLFNFNKKIILAIIEFRRRAQAVREDAEPAFEICKLQFKRSLNLSFSHANRRDHVFFVENVIRHGSIDKQYSNVVVVDCMFIPRRGKSRVDNHFVNLPIDGGILRDR